jgi:hypothetical protein
VHAHGVSKRSVNPCASPCRGEVVEVDLCLGRRPTSCTLVTVVAPPARAEVPRIVDSGPVQAVGQPVPT